MREIERAVERAIRVIHEDFGAQIGVDDIARAANYSRFHFTRLFYQVTGLTPRRFLVAVRLQKAKQLLTSTSLPVTDICHLVGYTSVGTFGSLFACNVGLPPTEYRRLGGFPPWISGGPHAGARGGRESCQVIRGDISLVAAEVARPVFVGLFRRRIPCGRPVGCAVLDRPGPYVLEKVPEGTWHVLACADRPDPDAAMLIGSAGPITVRGGIVRPADVRLRPMGVFDPPVVPALPDMRANRAPECDRQATSSWPVGDQGIRWCRHRMSLLP